MASRGVRKVKLDWVEAGRGIAAALVMLSHAGTTHPIPIDGDLLGFLGSTGVGFFFVLSGFIMVHVHRDDVGHPRVVPHFVWRRLGRIFPTYFVAFAIMLGVNLLQKSSVRVDVTPSFLAEQLLLLPGVKMFLGPAWTLRNELFFYFLFSFLLVDRRLGLALFAGWFCLLVGCLVVYGPWTQATDGFPDIYLHHVNLYFLMGIAVAVADRNGWLSRFAICCVGAAVILLGLSFTALTRDPAVLWIMGLFPAYAAILGGAVLMSKGEIRAPRFLVWLGAISYSLYLVHLSTFILLRGVDHLVGRPLDPIWPVRLAIQCAIAVGFAGLIHHLFERPALDWVNRRRAVLGFFVGRPDRAMAS